MAEILISWANIAVLYIVCVSFLIVWRWGRRKRASLSWAAGYFLAASAWLVETTVGELVEGKFLVTNLLYMTAIFTIPVGVHFWQNRKIPWKWFFVLGSIVMAGQYYYIYVDNFKAGRIAFYSIGLAAISLWAAVRVFSVDSVDKRLSSPLRAAGMMMVIFAVLMLAQYPMKVYGPDVSSFFDSKFNVLVLLVLQPAVLVGIGIFLLLGVTIELIIDLENLTVTDPLTRAANRRGFDVQAKAVVNRMHRTGSVFTLISVDLDHFKRVNDTFGHDVGDRVLVKFVQLLHEAVRPSDTVARIGGEEFVLILSDTDSEGARVVAERIRLSLHSLEFEETDPVYRPRASFGIAESNPEDRDITSTLKRSDEALYLAKSNGRDRVELSPVLVSAS